ncbi:hypothetical protein AN219_37690 [Streptomyces nanshensis]|nr:hypothetical protein AN219_37690 [Streptomyces nanshensis]
MMARKPVALNHFHCPKCYPELFRGVTPAVCGAVIPEAIVVPRGEPVPPSRNCPDCRRVRFTHPHKKGS